MLRSIKKIHGFKIQAKDGEIGKADGFYFDDHTWTIRYLVVDTGNWLVSRRVLISPHSLGKPDWEKEIFPINLTKEQIEKSPNVENDKPVSRQHEIDLVEYYGWPSYWTGVDGSMVGAIPPVAFYPPSETEEELSEMKRKEEEKFDPNLRSTNNVIGYNIHANDGDIGHAEDFLVDDNNWSIRYLVVDTKNWLPGGRKVVLALSWIKDINWADSNVKVNLTKEQIKNSPQYDSSKLIEREYELALYEHYDKPKYWE
ncbi:MAG: PRC-barrel domain containing protein [Ignavibacteriaceae bacterium]